MVSAWTPGGTNEQRAALGLGRYLLDDDTARAARVWIDQLSRGRALPVYGSREWIEAPADLRVAACVRAAEAHRREQMFAGQALADSFAADVHVDEVREAEEFAALAKQVQAMGSAGHADHAELQRRRAVVTRPGQEAA
jgi:hypothetical protein